MISARRKLIQFDAAVSLVDLRMPPGNRFEKLAADRAGRYCIRTQVPGRCSAWFGDVPTGC